jgi:thymidylate synthase ThyX
MITENTIGPFSVFFTNLNRQMALAGHSHFAEVRFTYRAQGDIKALAFPSFEDTHAEVQQALRNFFDRPFHDHTNEDIARALFEHFTDWTSPAIEKRGGTVHLVAVELAVRGVPDRIGHADGFTVYNVRA